MAQESSVDLPYFGYSYYDGELEGPNFTRQHLENYRYELSETEADWWAAEQNCTKKEGHLADDTPLNHHEVVAFGHGFWLRGNDIEHEGKWVWSTGGEEISPQNWKQGEPNNSGVEDCLQMGKKGWNDNKCRKTYKYLCKIKGILMDFFSC